jgi:hypothetical protein
MRDLFALVSKEVESTLSDAGAPPVVTQYGHLTDERVARFLDSSVSLENSYRSEQSRKGVFEYLMQARRYQMLFYMLLPLVGFASPFPSFRSLFLSLSFGLLIYGGISVFKRVRLEREENRERELERARDALRAQCRRVVADCARAWVRLVSQHLKDQAQATFDQVQGPMRTHDSERVETLAATRQGLQRQLQGLETSEHTLQIQSKYRDRWVSAAARLHGEIAPVLASVLQRHRGGRR